MEELKEPYPKQRQRFKESYPEQRQGFRLMLLSNPNYFGNLPDSVWDPILPMSFNTFYEELGCVGYHPQQQQLEAVVYVNQASGYGTDVCGPGTSEFVRFYLSFDGGATWVDQGMTSFQAFNIPDREDRLEYAVSLKADPPFKFCTQDLLIRVRAILSWNNPPPANQPDWPPVWGEVQEATVQVEPSRLLLLKQFFELAKIEMPPQFKQILDLEAPMPTKVQALGAAELAELYGDKVPPHRFALKEIQAFMSGTVNLSADEYVSLLPNVKLDPDLFDLIAPEIDGDTRYEELECIGLDPNTPDLLVGVLRMKLGSGYSGGPCTDGSSEYVTFWADLDDNGTFEVCLGTAEVTVYDLGRIPRGRVHYAIRLPVDLEPYRQPCEKGARLVRIRAILSWNIPAPCANPNHVPTWGNRKETLIHIPPLSGAPAGHIAILGGIPVGMINDTTGMTEPDAVFALNNLAPDPLGRPCPFGRRVSAQGVPIPGYSYVVEVSPDTLVWTPVLTDLVVTDQFGFTHDHKADPVTQRFAYLPHAQNVNGLLAEWDSAGDDMWHVRLRVFDGGGVEQGTPDTHRIQLDNTGPTAVLKMAPGTPACGKFPVGTILNGTVIARDEHLRIYRLYVLPNINPPGVGVPSPSSSFTQTGIAPGDPWTLNTTGMQSCGYILHLSVRDRTIRDSQFVGFWNGDSVGFCLE